MLDAALQWCLPVVSAIGFVGLLLLLSANESGEHPASVGRGTDPTGWSADDSGAAHGILSFLLSRCKLHPKQLAGGVAAGLSGMLLLAVFTTDSHFVLNRWAGLWDWHETAWWPDSVLDGWLSGILFGMLAMGGLIAAVMSFLAERSYQTGLWFAAVMATNGLLVYLLAGAGVEAVVMLILSAVIAGGILRIRAGAPSDGIRLQAPETTRSPADAGEPKAETIHAEAYSEAHSPGRRNALPAALAGWVMLVVLIGGISVTLRRQPSRTMDAKSGRIATALFRKTPAPTVETTNAKSGASLTRLAQRHGITFCVVGAIVVTSLACVVRHRRLGIKRQREGS